MASFHDGEGLDDHELGPEEIAILIDAVRSVQVAGVDAFGRLLSALHEVHDTGSPDALRTASDAFDTLDSYSRHRIADRAEAAAVAVVCRRNAASTPTEPPRPAPPDRPKTGTMGLLGALNRRGRGPSP